MKNTLIFAGLMAFITVSGAFAFSSATNNGGAGDFNTFSTAANATYPDTVKETTIRVATTNYVTARAGDAAGRVTNLTGLANSDNTIVGSGGASGLSKDLQDMGGGTCGSGGVCNGVSSGEETGDRLNVASLPSGATTSNYCSGSAGGYSIAACGYMKSGNDRQWIQIVGGVASGS